MSQLDRVRCSITFSSKFSCRQYSLARNQFSCCYEWLNYYTLLWQGAKHDWEINSGLVHSSFLYTMRATTESKNMSQVLHMIWRSYFVKVNYCADLFVCEVSNIQYSSGYKWHWQHTAETWQFLLNIYICDRGDITKETQVRTVIVY
jgi:hypothetical protein